MKFNLVAFFSGLIFGAGLLIGEMTRPERVIGFLNIFGDWDPSLIFVMGGAVSVYAILYPFIIKKMAPLIGDEFSIPESSDITSSLVVGSFLFGIGWGLGGYCPGPGITALGSFHIRPFTFVLSMVIGMWGYKFFFDRK